MTKIAPPIITIFLATLLFVGGFWLLIMPELKVYGQSQADLEAIQKQPITVTRAVNQKEILEKINDDKEKVEVLLPGEDKQYDLSVQIEGLSKKLGIPLSSLVISAADVGAVAPKTTAAQDQDAAEAVKTDSAVKKVSINVAISASYKEVQNFLSGLTSLDRFIQIDQLGLTVSSSTAATGTVTASPTPTASPGIAAVTDQVSAQITAFAYYLPSTQIKK